MFNAEEYKARLARAASILEAEKVPLPPVREGQSYVFISYAHADYKAVYRDLADLYEGGVRFWYDSGLHAGTAWDREVEEHLADPRCVGVVFYMSKNLFLSESVKREIALTTGVDKDTGEAVPGAVPKPYFSVNLTDRAPSDILFTVTPEEKTRSRLDFEWVMLLSRTFSDRKTYLSRTAPGYADMLIGQIRDQFGAVRSKYEEDRDEGLFVGDTRDGKKDGYGKMTYPDGSVYVGEWANDKPHGRGKLTYPNGESYDGDWQEGEATGRGVLIRPGLFRYEGEVESGQAEGMGKAIYPDGSTYEGEMSFNCASGNGVKRYADGSVYEGEWEADDREGQGTMFYADGSVYEGDWEADKRDGWGKLTLPDGTVREGGWTEDEFDG